MTDSPAQVEAEAQDSLVVDHDGETYTFPASLDDADGDVLDAIDDQKLSRALRGLMSPADWTRFKATKPKVRDYARMFEAYATAIGLGNAGE